MGRRPWHGSLLRLSAVTSANPAHRSSQASSRSPIRVSNNARAILAFTFTTPFPIVPLVSHLCRTPNNQLASNKHPPQDRAPRCCQLSLVAW